MATWKFTVANFTPEAVAGGTNYTNSKYLGLMGGSTTQMIRIKEIMIDGLEPSTSSPCIMLLGRDSTVQATPTALTTGEYNAAEHPATAALAAAQVAFTASTTKPQRSTTLVLGQYSFNA